MKKWLGILLLLIIVTTEASAQGPGATIQSIRRDGILRLDRASLRKDMMRLSLTQRNARREEIRAEKERKKMRKEKNKRRRRNS